MEAPEPGGRIDHVLSKLDRVKRAQTGFMARCPAHEDRGPSLSVREGRRGILLNCFAGCSINDVRVAAGLTWSDLFYEGSEPENEAPPVDRRGQALEALAAADRLRDEPDAVAGICAARGWSRRALELLGVGWDGERLTIPVVDEKGRAHDVLRYDPGAARYKMLAGRGRSRLPWPAPEGVETKGRTRGLCLVEGEGTALSLASVGLPVVALPGAVARASGDVRRPGHFEGVGWHRAWARRFRKFGRVWLFPDADDVGRNLMRTVAYDLENDHHGVRPIVVDLGGPKGADLGDLLAPARSLALRRQGRDLVLMLADVATRDPSGLDEARELAFAWSAWARDGKIERTAEAPPDPAPAPVLAPGEIDWV